MEELWDTGAAAREAAADAQATDAPQPCSFCGSADVPVPYSALPCQHRSVPVP